MLTNINVRGGSLNLKKLLKMVIPGISKLFVIYRLYIKDYLESLLSIRTGNWCI